MGGAALPAARPRRQMDLAARCASATLLLSAAPAAATGQGRFDEDAVRRQDVDTDKSIALSIAVLAGLLAVCVFSAVIAPKWFGIGGRRPAEQQQEQHRKNKKAVTCEEILERLPPAKTPRNSDGGGQPSCVVCLCEVDVDEESITTQCGHVFHKECVLQWWTHKPRRSIRCPTCRTKQKIRSKSRDGTPRSPQVHPIEVQSEGGDEDEIAQVSSQPATARQESWLPDLEAGRRTGPSLMLPVNIAHSPLSAAPTDFTARMSVADEATPASQMSAMPPMPLPRSPSATGSTEVVESV